MTTSAVEVITRGEPRRRWTLEEKQRLVAAATAPGAVVSEVARTAGIPVGQLFHWRKDLLGPVKKPEFTAVSVVPPPAANLIEVEFASGARLRITGSHDPAVMSALIGALSRDGRRR